jgi:hypothetical protein
VRWDDLLGERPLTNIFLRLLVLLTKWKPEWLYEVMPIIYVSAGFASFFYFDSLVGYGAGTLFLIAAFLIWVMRLQNRAQNAASTDHSKHSILK